MSAKTFDGLDYEKRVIHLCAWCEASTPLNSQLAALNLSGWLVTHGICARHRAEMLGQCGRQAGSAAPLTGRQAGSAALQEAAL